MIGYVTLGTNDRDKADAFYDALLGELGCQRLFNNETLQFWGRSMEQPLIGVGAPYDGAPASAGNGAMVALSVDTKDAVAALHAKALELGGADEGEPGPRGPDGSGFYGAYFRDLDGNKFVVFTIVAG